MSLPANFQFVIAWFVGVFVALWLGALQIFLQSFHMVDHDLFHLTTYFVILYVAAGAFSSLFLPKRLIEYNCSLSLRFDTRCAQACLVSVDDVLWRL